MSCSACPRRCSADRTKANGICRAPEAFKLARASLHFWEEPCISGKNGSGTVFFSGCSLKCVYCQNYEISHECFGKEVSGKRLFEIFDELIERGAHNINLVNPTHYAPRLAELLKKHRPSVPVVYNSSGYESVETLRELEGLVDVYLTDFKYISSERAEKYSKASDYPERCIEAIAEMKRQQPVDVFDAEGMMQKGMIIRHLILPKNTNQSVEIMKTIAGTFGTETYVSIMAQYTPCGDISAFEELNRRITAREYEKVVCAAEEAGLKNIFVQELNSADSSFIPEFDLNGI